METLRTAIIGCGGIARRHAAHLSQLPDVELVGFCDVMPERTAHFNETFCDGAGQAFEDYERMFQTLDLDLVYICLPPFAHGREVKLAAEFGVHLLIEKPIALTMDMATEMAEQVRKSGVKSQVGFMYRHGEAVQWLHNHIQQGNLSGSGFVVGQYYCNSLHAPWWRDRSRSGGQLVEQIIHTIDLARLYLGEPVRVFSIQENLFHRQVADYTAEDASGTVVQFEAGGLAVIVGSNGALPGRWISSVRVMLPGLTADFDGPNRAVFHHTGGPWPSTTTIDSERDEYLAETLDLIRAIREDRPTAVPIDEGVRSLRLALAAAEAAELGVPVDIPASD